MLPVPITMTQMCFDYQRSQMQPEVLRACLVALEPNQPAPRPRRARKPLPQPLIYPVPPVPYLQPVPPFVPQQVRP